MTSSNLHDLSNLLTARLSRHIVFWVFLSLILIEAIILIPSVQRREREMLTQIRQVSSGKVLWIATTYSQVSADRFLAEVKKLQQDPMLRMIQGGALYRQNGQLVGSFGEQPELSFAEAMTGNPMDFEISDRFFPKSTHYDAAWSIPHFGGPYLLILRHDAASVGAEVSAFVVRIAGLVLIIAVVVTLTTLAVLGATVITPILRLRQDLIAAGDAVSADQPMPRFYSAVVNRRDELGDVIAAFYQMFKQIWQAMSDRKQAERELAEANQEIMMLNQKLTTENLRMSAELAVSRKLQQMLLPKEQELNQIPGLAIAGFMEPAAEVGGDYYDILSHDDAVKISVGDVTGHGLESGVVMLMAQTATRTLLTHNESDPVKFLNTLNQTIHSNIQRMGCDKSLTLALLDYQDGMIQLSGQHEEVIVVRDNGKIERIDTLSLGFPLGLEADITDLIAQTNIYLNPGDGIVLYTDGITEALNDEKECYGIERLCTVVQQHWQQSVQEIQQAVIRDVKRHIGNQIVHDDITLLVLKQK
ncbi:MAG: SpoIIE family protein phosphatase [Elainella sp. C42_A2020_010]|nr:SpoIIE family protein phosphatase [Elainella sp. C42_A2020_010]